MVLNNIFTNIFIYFLKLLTYAIHAFFSRCPKCIYIVLRCVPYQSGTECALFKKTSDTFCHPLIRSYLHCLLISNVANTNFQVTCIWLIVANGIRNKSKRKDLQFVVFFNRESIFCKVRGELRIALWTLNLLVEEFRYTICFKQN